VFGGSPFVVRLLANCILVVFGQITASVISCSRAPLVQLPAMQQCPTFPFYWPLRSGAPPSSFASHFYLVRLSLTESSIEILWRVLPVLVFLLRGTQTFCPRCFWLDQLSGN